MTNTTAPVSSSLKRQAELIQLWLLTEENLNVSLEDCQAVVLANVVESKILEKDLTLLHGVM